MGGESSEGETETKGLGSEIMAIDSEATWRFDKGQGSGVVTRPWLLFQDWQVGMYSVSATRGRSPVTEWGPNR